jgi:putative hydrolase of the HAD superfamily
MMRHARSRELAAPKVVFFDAGGTLLRVRPSIGEIYSEIAARRNHTLEPKKLEAAFKRHFLRVQEEFRAKRGLAFGRDEHEAMEFWIALVSAAVAEAGAVRWATSEECAADFSEYVAALYAEFEDPARWSAEPGAAEALREVRSMGLKTGVISNWDTRLKSLLEALGLGDLIDVYAASHVAGFEKPDPRLFQRAAELAGVAPQDAWHIGDSSTLDCRPAREAGFGLAILYRPRPEDIDPRDRLSPVVESLDEAVMLASLAAAS